MNNMPGQNTWSATKRDGGNPNWPIVITSSELHGLDPLTGENVVAVVNHGHKDRAHLMAALPDLLAELRKWIEPYSGFSPHELARRADPATLERIASTQVVIAQATTP